MRWITSLIITPLCVLACSTRSTSCVAVVLSIKSFKSEGENWSPVVQGKDPPGRNVNDKDIVGTAWLFNAGDTVVAHGVSSKLMFFDQDESMVNSEYSGSERIAVKMWPAS